jgi:1-deoxy-D-xylulose-5-phosphate reductoisomerase
MKQVTVLGATGSIGVSTLDVLGRHPDRYAVFALSAHRQVGLLREQCLRHEPRHAVVGDPVSARELQESLRQAGCSTEVHAGPQALEAISAANEVDCVMAAIVGAAGLRPAVAAARAGKQVLLANKESLVMAGEVFLDACRAGQASVLPIDSEHNAVFQCLPALQPTGRLAAGVKRILLTASGGPFRRASSDQIEVATPAEAIAHPNWSMGRKISVDSASMMNKGLELIEAHYLFGVPDAQLDVVVHPQSIIHSMVEYEDGSVLAQLGNPDMRTPIAHALAYPDRIRSGVKPLDLAAIGHLDFEPPDPTRFPCLRLAREALRARGAAPCVLNAANEVAVQAFLEGALRFGAIARVNESVLQAMGSEPAGADIETVIDLDARARVFAQRALTEWMS